MLNAERKLVLLLHNTSNAGRLTKRIFVSIDIILKNQLLGNILDEK